MKEIFEIAPFVQVELTILIREAFILLHVKTV